MGIRRKTNVEVILGRLGGRVFEKPDGSPSPNQTEPSDEDRERIVAYAEGRLSPSDARKFQRRLLAEPALREAMADFLIDIRGTDYGRSLLAGTIGAEERQEARAAPSASHGAREALARLFGEITEAFSPRRPVFALVCATVAVLFVVGVLWYGAVVRPAGQARAVLAQAEHAVQQGDYAAANTCLAAALQSPRIPDSVRQRAGQVFESAVVAQSDILTRQREFAQAVAVLDEALAVQPDRPVLLAQAGDVRFQALRAAEGRPPELDRAETPQYQTKGLAFETPGRQAELDRILDLYRRAAQNASVASITKVPVQNDLVVRALIGQSRVEIEKGDLSAATDVLGRARALAPDSADVQNALGRLFLEKGRGDLARDAFERSIRFDPTPANPARWNLDSLFGPGASGQNPATPGQDTTPQSPTPTPAARNQSDRSALDALFDR